MFQAGVGSFQALAALYLGLCLAADTIEFFSISYILPSAEVELCIEDSEKGWLSKYLIKLLTIYTLLIMKKIFVRHWYNKIRIKNTTNCYLVYCILL